jgi:hypothetical protein
MPDKRVNCNITYVERYVHIHVEVGLYAASVIQDVRHEMHTWVNQWGAALLQRLCTSTSEGSLSCTMLLWACELECNLTGIARDQQVAACTSPSSPHGVLASQSDQGTCKHFTDQQNLYDKCQQYVQANISKLFFLPGHSGDITALTFTLNDI